MKDRWKFCQCCYLNGHCENQDRDMKCETYPKQLEDKVKRLQKQLEIATKAFVDIIVENPHNGDEYWDQDKAQQALKEIEEVK